MDQICDPPNQRLVLKAIFSANFWSSTLGKLAVLYETLAENSLFLSVRCGPNKPNKDQ